MINTGLIHCLTDTGSILYADGLSFFKQFAHNVFRNLGTFLDTETMAEVIVQSILKIC